MFGLDRNRIRGLVIFFCRRSFGDFRVRFYDMFRVGDKGMLGVRVLGMDVFD